MAFTNATGNISGPCLRRKARVLLNKALEARKWRGGVGVQRGGGGEGECFWNLITLNLKWTTTCKNIEVLHQRQSELNLEKLAMCIVLHPIIESLRHWVTE